MWVGWYVRRQRGAVSPALPGVERMAMRSEEVQSQRKAPRCWIHESLRDAPACLSTAPTHPIPAHAKSFDAYLPVGMHELATRSAARRAWRQLSRAPHQKYSDGAPPMLDRLARRSRSGSCLRVPHTPCAKSNLRPSASRPSSRRRGPSANSPVVDACVPNLHD